MIEGEGNRRRLLQIACAGIASLMLCDVRHLFRATVCVAFGLGRPDVVAMRKPMPVRILLFAFVISSAVFLGCELLLHVGL
jgi:hypothetical protein